MRLSTKIFVLISLPLAFQLGMSIFILTQLFDTNQKIEQEQSRKRIVAALDEVQHNHVRGIAAAAFYSISQDQAIGEKHLATLKQLATALKQLRELTDSDSRLAQRTEALQRSILSVIPYEMMMRKFSLLESRPQYSASNQARQNIKESMQQIESYQTSLVPPVDDIDELRASTVRLQAVLGGALLLVIAFSLLMLFWSQKYVIAVLNILLQQIEKFKNGESIQPQINSNDEMAELERALCDSANRLARLDNMRRELCSIVSHDIRAPMTSINGLVTLLESGAFGKLAAEHEQLVARLQIVCTKLLEVLNDILDLDKLRSGRWSFAIENCSIADIKQEVLTQLRDAGFASLDAPTPSETSFLCDKESLARCIGILARSLSNKAKQISFRLLDESGHNVWTLSVQKLPDSASTAGDTDTITTLALARQFCEKQSLSFEERIANDGATVVISPRKNQFSLERLGTGGTSKDSSVPTKRLSNVGKLLLDLIGRPMAASATAIVLLGVLLTQVGHDIGREIVSKEIVHLATRLSSDMTHLMLVSIRRQSDEVEPEARLKIENKIDYDLSALKLLESKTKLSMPAELELVEKKVADIKALSDQLATKPLDQLSPLLKDQIKEGKLTGIVFTKAGSLVADREETALRMSNIRSNILWVLIATSFVTAVLTLVGAVQVSRRFTARLESVAENAGRLSRKETLTAPAPGTDEIAGLDAFFFAVASEIEQLEKERKEISRLLRAQLKAPLTVLRDGFQQIHDEAKDVSPKLKSHLEKAIVEIQRLNDLADDLLLLDSMEEDGRLKLDLNLAPVVVTDLMRQSSAAVSHMAALKRISIDLRQSEPDTSVMADRGRTVQILVNLLSNAVKFSPEDSDIEFSLAIDHQSRTAKLSVKDRGRGIPADQAHKIFARYDQVFDADQAKGSGLGLFISKNLAEAQNGCLEFESKDGSGSTFWLVLPLGPPAQSST